jgi:hypothetical protein
MSAPDLPVDPFHGPWFDSKTAAAYVPCKTVKAWYEWRKRHGIVARANGSVAKADLDRVLRLGKRKHTGGAARHPNSLANLAKSPKRQPLEVAR